MLHFPTRLIIVACRDIRHCDYGTRILVDALDIHIFISIHEALGFKCMARNLSPIE